MCALKSCGIAVILLAPFLAFSHADEATSLTIETDAVSANIQSFSRLESEQAQLRKLVEEAPKAYKDKVLDSRSLDQIAADELQTVEKQSEGFQLYSIESRVGVRQSDTSGGAQANHLQAGVKLDYQLETRDYGDVQVQVNTSTKRDAYENALLNRETYTQQAEQVTVRSRNLPLTEKLQADTELGDVVSRAPARFARHSRIGLGQRSVRGAGTRIYNDTLDITAGTGKRGYLIGEPYSGFSPSSGQMSWLGMSHTLNEHVDVGAQFNAVSNMETNYLQKPSDASTTDITNTALSAKYTADKTHPTDKQASVVVVTSQKKNALYQADASGIFFEGDLKKGNYQHQLGLFTTQPELYLGESELTGGTGGYWRVDHRDRQRFVGGSLEWEQTLSPNADSQHDYQRVGVGGHAQQVFSRGRSVGGNMQISQTIYEPNLGINTTNDSRALHANAFYEGKFLKKRRSRVSVTMRRNETLVANGNAATGDEIQWEQDWLEDKYETMRPELTTTIGLAHDRTDADYQTYPTVGVRGRYWVNADWNVAGSLTHTSRTGNLSTSQGLAGSVSSDYDLGKGWSAGGSLSMNEAKVDAHTNNFYNPLVSRTTDKSAYLYVRWQGTHGKPYQTLGNQKKGTKGTGSIRGVVFFDANRDGRKQADEATVPNVEMTLDDGFTLRTDATGILNLKPVAVGTHQLKINTDSVPLPWEIEKENGYTVDVPLRGEIQINIPLIKINE